jgi:hypothetical protein
MIFIVHENLFQNKTSLAFLLLILSLILLSFQRANPMVQNEQKKSPTHTSLEASGDSDTLLIA